MANKVAKQRKSNRKGKQPEHLKGKGFDGHPEHINRKGRIMPKAQKELNALLDEIFGEVLVNETTHERTERLRLALRNLLHSKNPAGTIHLLDRRFGKVPLKVEGPGDDGALKVIVEYVRSADTSASAAPSPAEDQD